MTPGQANLKKISCKSDQQDLAVFTPVVDKEVKSSGLKKAKGVYAAVIDKALSSGYIGAVTDEDNRWVSLDEKESNKTDLLSDWDGASGIYLRLPKGVIDNNKKFDGKSFMANLKVVYLNIAEDTVENDVTCTRE